MQVPHAGASCMSNETITTWKYSSLPNPDFKKSVTFISYLLTTAVDLNDLNDF